MWFWRPLAGAKLARMLCIAPITVTKRSWTPGRARRKPLKPSRRKCRIVFGEPVVTTLVCFFYSHARLRVHRASGISCALFSSRDVLMAQLGRARVAGMLRHASIPHPSHRSLRSRCATLPARSAGEGSGSGLSGSLPHEVRGGSASAEALFRFERAGVGAVADG